jgi:signal peptidase I
MKTSAKGFYSVLAAFFVAIFLKAFVFDFMLVDGRSMSPALKPGDAVVVFRLAYGLRRPFAAADAPYLLRWKTPRTGEVAVFWTPLGGLAVKRVAELVTSGGGETGGRTALIMLGDNSAESFDSRSYGPVTPDCVVGRVLFR